MANSASHLSVVPNGFEPGREFSPGLTVRLAWDQESQRATVHVSVWGARDDAEFTADLAVEQGCCAFCKPVRAARQAPPLHLAR